MASTTQIKHCFMCRPSLQDSQQLEKPHLLPWSRAIGPQPDPNKHHLFYTTKEKEIEGESGARGMQRRSEGFSKKKKKKRVSAWGFGVDELRKETTGGLRALGSTFQLNFSLLETVI